MMLKAPDFWQKSSSWESSLLLPLATLWGWGAWCHKKLSHPRRLPLPVISVGNVTLGGGGKTPLVAYLACYLTGSMIVTRGYGKTFRSKPILVKDHRALNVGDEPLLLSKIAPTWVSTQRYQGARAAFNHGAKAIILDDAHQNYDLHKDISLLVVHGQLGWGNQKVFPAGPLREPLDQALERASALVIMGPDQAGIANSLKGRLPIFKASIITPFRKVLTARPYAAFAGIAYPQKFLSLLRQLEIEPSPFITYPDHHAFSFHELAFLNGLSETHQLLTTEKDWVRLPKTLQEKVTYVPIHLEIGDPPSFHSFLTQAIQTKEKEREHLL